MTPATVLNHSRLASEAQQFIDVALTASAGRVCVTSSFQAECVALVHMLVERRPEIPVLFLDTGYHFPETLEYRDRIAAALDLNVVNLTPKLTVAQQESQFGILYASQPDRCCAMRKVEPLFRALEEYDTWFTGLRREQSKTRAQLRPIDDFRLPTGKVLCKVSPLADWSAREVWGYLREHGIPTLPLYERGYASIGCAPCTSLPPDPDDPRSGRWAGRKLECGIHIQS